MQYTLKFYFYVMGVHNCKYCNYQGANAVFDLVNRGISLLIQRGQSGTALTALRFSGINRSAEAFFSFLFCSFPYFFLSLCYYLDTTIGHRPS